MRQWTLALWGVLAWRVRPPCTWLSRGAVRTSRHPSSTACRAHAAADADAVSRRNPFNILGLAPTAGVEEVRPAFRRLAKACHPDVPITGCAERFRAALWAAEELSREGGFAFWQRQAAPDIPDPVAWWRQPRTPKSNTAAWWGQATTPGDDGKAWWRPGDSDDPASWWEPRARRYDDAESDPAGWWEPRAASQDMPTRSPPIYGPTWNGALPRAWNRARATKAAGPRPIRKRLEPFISPARAEKRQMRLERSTRKVRQTDRIWYSGSEDQMADTGYDWL